MATCGEGGQSIEGLVQGLKAGTAGPPIDWYLRRRSRGCWLNSRDGLGQLPPGPSSGMAGSWSIAVERLLISRLSWEEVEAEVCPETPPKEQRVPTEGEQQGIPTWRPSGGESRLRLMRRRRMWAAGACGSGDAGAVSTLPGRDSVRSEETVGLGGGSARREMRSFGSRFGTAAGEMLLQACCTQG